MDDLWCVVPCMGRLEHLKRSLPLLLDAGLRVVLVDYSCPDGCGDWASREEGDAVRAGTLAVVRVPGRRVFHKARAHNIGAACALGLGAKFVCFIDSDTLVTHAFADWIRAHAREGRFGLVEPARGSGDLTGVLLVSAADLERLKGFDEGFVGYGKEDIEIRLRYRLLGKLEYDLMPASLARSIPHPDELRTRHYVQQDRRRSDRTNFQRLCKLVERWTGERLGELQRPDLTPLLGIYPVTPRASAVPALSKRDRRLQRRQQRAQPLRPPRG
jgi:GT2 family glycosyltransferase